MLKTIPLSTVTNFTGFKALLCLCQGSAILTDTLQESVLQLTKKAQELLLLHSGKPCW